MADPTRTAALKIPILPHTTPQAPQPPLKTPLYPHQLRALHRIRLIENDGSLSSDFGAQHSYSSRGGCLADAVGMGKTATMIGLIAADKKRYNGEGDTLVVAPGHLIPQWKAEIEKFSDDIEVVVGNVAYGRVATVLPTKAHRVVLVDVETILNESRVWYDFKRIFSGPRGGQLRLDADKFETYRKAALFCVKSPRGPCSYTGWVYTGCLHLPYRGWRRVIYDEIQDLVSEGTESQKNLLQLSRTAKNVWLLTATPFPHGNTSVYANHELLGFCRLRMDVEVNYELSPYHPFEKIKRKLYIRSPKHVSDEAVTATKLVTKETIYIDATPLERKFFELEKNGVPNHRDKFHNDYVALRQMMVHPEASKKLREQINGKDRDQRDGEKARKVAQKNNAVGRYSSVDSFARSSLAQARARYSQVESYAIPTASRDVVSARSSLYLAMKVRQVRASPIRHNPFANQNETQVEPIAELEAKAIRDYYQHNPVSFETLGSANQPKVKILNVERIVDYFQNEMKQRRMIPWGESQREALEVFIAVKEGAITRNTDLIKNLNKEKTELESRIKALESTVSVGKSKVKSDVDDLAARHGSKSATLIRYLQDMKEKEQTIVFSYWHDTLRLVHRSLKRCGLSVSFCDGNSHAMAKALSDFTSGASSVLLLSAHAKASGANLQMATNVILLDPAGSSAEHGAALEQQAIGRAVRMGQSNAVKVVRFCVKGSIEEVLFDKIDEAASKLAQRSNDQSYTCENSHKSLGIEEVEETEEDEQDDCCIGETLTDKERVARKLAEAVANNDVICIDDSDDEEDREPAANEIEPSPSNAHMLVSQVSSDSMPTTGKRVSETLEQSIHSDKKAKTETAVERTAPETSASHSVGLQIETQTHAVSTETQTITESVFNRFPLTHKDCRWVVRFEELEQVKARTGLAWVAGQCTDLSKWCSSQRKAYKKGALSAARVSALNSIDFPWTHHENYRKQATPAGKLNEHTAAPLPLVTPALKNRFEAAATPLDAIVADSKNSERVVSPTAQEQVATAGNA